MYASVTTLTLKRSSAVITILYSVEVGCMPAFCKEDRHGSSLFVPAASMPAVGSADVSSHSLSGYAPAVNAIGNTAPSGPLTVYV